MLCELCQGAILKIGKYSDVGAILIEAVRKHPCLWNTSEAKYKNRTVKENAWTAVAEEVNAESGKTYSGKFYLQLIIPNNIKALMSL